MHARSWLSKSILLGVCLTTSACSNDISIQGAGATFPAPIYKRWFLEYYQNSRKKSEGSETQPVVRVNYQAIGSGAGIRQFEQNLPDFAATDAHPKKTDKVMQKGIFLLPMTAGAVAICYNLPGGPKVLKLGRDVYPKIFLGEITKWNDKAIAKYLEPGETLPDTPIIVVHRADSSGTTFVFTNHLNAIYDGWKKENKGPGANKQVKWPTDKMDGLAGRGNAGVASIIKLTPGAIGYTEHSYAELAELAIAHLQNKDGEFVPPNEKTNLAALSGPNLKKFFDTIAKTKEEDNYHIEITNPVGRDAYPIVTFTWMIVKRHYADEKIGNALKKVLVYCLTEGQKISADLGYIPLDDELAREVLKTVDKIKVGKE